MNVKNYVFEKFGYTQLNDLPSALDIDKKLILFFDLNYNGKLNTYLSSNYLKWVDSFKEAERNFVYLPKIGYPDSAPDVFKYYIPHLKSNMLSELGLRFDMPAISLKTTEKEKPSYDNVYKDTLKTLNYYWNIKTGFLFFYDNVGYVVKYDDEDFNNNRDKLLQELLQFFTDKKRYEDSNLFSSRRSIDDFEEVLKENLDSDAQNKIDFIKQQLEGLKSSGNILFALPILKKILKEYSREIDLSSVSKIHITEDYRVLLPYFDNMEVELSQLTRAVYILFYQNSEGINIKELRKYENQLKSIYTNISSQLDYDAILQSVKELVMPESKAIYTHISRIKSAFYKLMDKHYAQHYIITGEKHGSPLKYIPIIKPKEEVEEWSKEDLF